MVKFLSNETTKMKLAMLAFLCCGDFVKNPNVNLVSGKSISINSISELNYLTPQMHWNLRGSLAKATENVLQYN